MILCNCLGISEEDYKEIHTDWFFNRNSNDIESYILDNVGNICGGCQQRAKQIEDNIKLLYS